MTDPVRAIADAVLYEGYLLWPYRRSATKNQRRWTFGGVHPQGHSERHPDDAWVMRAECLAEDAGDARVEVRARFLQVVARGVAREGAGGLEPVDELTVAGTRHLAFDEAVEREVTLGPLPLGALARSRRCRSPSRPGARRRRCASPAARAPARSSAPGSRSRARSRPVRKAWPTASRA